MAKRGRQPGFQMTEEHRVKIKNSNILNALIEHVEGQREMNPSQVSAGLGLLRKVMPDLTSSDNKTEVLHRYSKEMSDDELAGIASGSSNGVASASVDPTKLN